MESLNNGPMSIRPEQIHHLYLLTLILSSADENMDLWENGQRVGHLDGTREEWLERIQALRDAEDNPQ